MKIAIIGAGLSGLTLANKLGKHFDVTLFEKSHSVGGRMATRERDGFSFDHGAQYFSVKTDAFQDFLKPYLDSHVVRDWSPNIVRIDREGVSSPIIWEQKRYVAAPRIRSLCEDMSKGLDVRLNEEITKLEKTANGWLLRNKDGAEFDSFDWVVTSVPSHQAARLLPKTFHHDLSHTKMLGCYALMLGFDRPIDLPFDAALIEGEAVSWICVNSHKPVRDGGYSLLVQSSNAWADARLELPTSDIKADMMAALETIIGQRLPLPTYQELHKWRYANVAQSAGQAYLIDEGEKLAAIGDWCLFGKIEAAFSSGAALAERLRQLNR